MARIIESVKNKKSYDTTLGVGKQINTDKI